MKKASPYPHFLCRSLLLVTLLLATALSTKAAGGAGQLPPNVPPSVVTHTVLLRFSPQAAPALIQQALAHVAMLQVRIPGMVSVSYGENFSSRAHGFTHGITLRFVNRAALEAFYPHAAHQEFIATSLKPILAELLVMDYEEITSAK